MRDGSEQEIFRLCLKRIRSSGAALFKDLRYVKRKAATVKKAVPFVVRASGVSGIEAV